MIFHINVRAAQRSSPPSCIIRATLVPGNFRVRLGVVLGRGEEGAEEDYGGYRVRVVGRWQNIERRALNSKRRLRSPTNALAVSSIGGVGWEVVGRGNGDLGGDWVGTVCGGYCCAIKTTMCRGPEIQERSRLWSLPNSSRQREEANSAVVAADVV